MSEPLDQLAIVSKMYYIWNFLLWATSYDMAIVFLQIDPP
jgi:hypothetical protein